MARKPRVHAPGALYHVMLRGNAGAALFSCNDDRRRLEALVAEGVGRFGHQVFAYCWMTNHLHLAVQVGDVPLSKIVQNFAFRYARWFNWREGRVGHLFQGRFKALRVDRDRYLLALVRYIHRNPVKAGLVAAPEDYRWSSHRAYLGLARTTWLSTGAVLELFGHKVGESRRRFQAFVAEDGEAEGEQGALGDAETEERIDLEAVPPGGLDPGIGRVAPTGLTIEEVCRRVGGELGVSPTELVGPSRARPLARARHLAGMLILEVGCGTLSELGRHFGRDLAALHRGITRMKRAAASDPELHQVLERCRRSIEQVK